MRIDLELMAAKPEISRANLQVRVFHLECFSSSHIFLLVRVRDNNFWRRVNLIDFERVNVVVVCFECRDTMKMSVERTRTQFKVSLAERNVVKRPAWEISLSFLCQVNFERDG
jgi:hypothetical protein